MGDIYFYETIDECEKEIVDKSIVLDLMQASNINLIESIKTGIHSILFVTALVAEFLNIYFKADSTLTIFLAYIAINIAISIIISWVKYNYRHRSSKDKCGLVDGILIHCKEYQEAKYEDWQKKQLLKRFAELASINIDWDNVK